MVRIKRILEVVWEFCSFFVRTAMGEASKGSLIHGGAELKIGFK